MSITLSKMIWSKRILERRKPAAFRHLVALFAAIALWIGSAPGATALEEETALSLVERTSTEIIQLANSGAGIAQQREEFVRLLNTRADADRIARLTMGREWRAMSQSQRQGYRDAIIPYIAARFVKNFGDFRRGTLEVRSAQLVTVGGEKRVLVQSVGKRRPAASGIEIEWTITERGGQPLILDVGVANLSLVVTQRKEIGTILNSVRGDYDQLISKLVEATERSS